MTNIHNQRFNTKKREIIAKEETENLCQSSIKFRFIKNVVKHQMLEKIITFTHKLHKIIKIQENYTKIKYGYPKQT